MLNFCTLFDSNYLTRGLAMYHSLSSCEDTFHLYIFAFDDQAFRILNKLMLKNVTVISLQDFEDEELLAVKPNRSKAEYCWTCTPSTIKYVIDKFKVDNCTYIDADLYFYNSPKVLLEEMNSNSVLITEHRYTKKYDRSEIAGKYCVQFITFKNDSYGIKVLDWWRNACLEWCYNRYEDGKFGDQKYLDDWTTRFEKVHVLQHHGGGLAPWNIQQYRIQNIEENNIFLSRIEKNVTFKVIFYHYHYVRFYKNNVVDLGWFKLAKSMVQLFYNNYINALDKSLNQVKTINPEFEEKLRPFSIKDSENFKDQVKFLIKKISKYNLYKKHQLK